MCVIFFYVNSNPKPGGYKLILASNRDEFYARNTQYVCKWRNAEHVYGGIDLEVGREGGTWLAVSGKDNLFKVGALLNLTGEPKPRNAIGRGMIVSDFVKNYDKPNTIENYTSNLIADCTKYSAFNFISIEIGPRTIPAKIIHCSNVPISREYYEEQKCYGFGNSLPTAPFEKVRYGEDYFSNVVKEFLEEQEKTKDTTITRRLKLIDSLLELLKCELKFWPDAELQKRAPNWGEELSAINCHVANNGYGSRTHSIILIDGDDKLTFHEETMASENPKDEWLKTTIEQQYFKNP